MLEILFDKGTILLANTESYQELIAESMPYLKWDNRVQQYRAPAYHYRNCVLSIRQHQVKYLDKARNFMPTPMELMQAITPRYYQNDALQAFERNNFQGVITLPTGAGKTILAVMAIAKICRPTLVHVPTIDLMHQWHEVLTKYFQMPIGLLGGGYNEEQIITVSTYDSALIHVPYKGNKFGFLVFDECHHLPGEQLQYTAISSIAPFRLGLTATPERSDGKEYLLDDICGPICYQAQITALEGSTLAPYVVKTIEVEMQPEELALYQQARKTYLNFAKQQCIDFSQVNGWQQFIWKSQRSTNGKEAFKAYLLQKKLALASNNKEKQVWELLVQHRYDRIIIFTQDNETAYNFGKKFFLPVITHHTKVKERELFLDAFRTGEFNILITSKVLNEGVDVPDANVAIIVSGSGTVREHVQRLGRILRAQNGKKAFLYELISKNTAEYFINQRRRQHSAYTKRTLTL